MKSSMELNLENVKKCIASTLQRIEEGNATFHTYDSLKELYAIEEVLEKAIAETKVKK